MSKRTRICPDCGGSVAIPDEWEDYEIEELLREECRTLVSDRLAEGGKEN